MKVIGFCGPSGVGKTTLIEQLITELKSRGQLQALYQASPLGSEELLFNLGLYTRSSLLVKFIVMSQLYERILPIPGLLMEFGVWWGQNLVMLENLRRVADHIQRMAVRTCVSFMSGTGRIGH